MVRRLPDHHRPGRSRRSRLLKAVAAAREQYRTELAALDAVLDGPAPDSGASQLPELRQRADAAEKVLRNLVHKLEDLEADAGCLKNCG